MITSEEINILKNCIKKQQRLMLLCIPAFVVTIVFVVIMAFIGNNIANYQKTITVLYIAYIAFYLAYLTFIILYARNIHKPANRVAVDVINRMIDSKKAEIYPDTKELVYELTLSEYDFSLSVNEKEVLSFNELVKSMSTVIRNYTVVHNHIISVIIEPLKKGNKYSNVTFIPCNSMGVHKKPVAVISNYDANEATYKRYKQIRI